MAQAPGQKEAIIPSSSEPRRVDTKPLTTDTPLTPVQKNKLPLAGRRDIKRLLDRIEDERKTFEHLRTDLTRCQGFLMQLQPLGIET